MKKITRQLLIAFLVFLIFASVLSFITLPATKPAAINLTALLTQIDEDKIESITVKENNLEIVLKDGTKQVLEKEPSESLSTMLKNYNVDPAKLKNIAIDIKSESDAKFWAAAILPFLIQSYVGTASLTLGGTSLLIVVSVVLETIRQIESLTVTRSYESFLK